MLHVATLNILSILCFKTVRPLTTNMDSGSLLSILILFAAVAYCVTQIISLNGVVTSLEKQLSAPAPTSSALTTLQTDVTNEANQLTSISATVQALANATPAPTVAPTPTPMNTNLNFLNVNDNANFNGNVTVKENLTIDGQLTLNQPLNIGGTYLQAIQAGEIDTSGMTQGQNTNGGYMPGQISGTVVFTSPMPDAHYIVIATPTQVGTESPVYSDQFSIRIWNRTPAGFNWTARRLDFNSGWGDQLLIGFLAFSLNPVPVVDGFGNSCVNNSNCPAYHANNY